MHALVIFLAVLAGLALLVVITRIFTRKLTRPGYIPPAASKRAQSQMRGLTRFLTWLFVGKLEVEGLENLDKVPAASPYMLTPNHSSHNDVWLVPAALAEHQVRYMVHKKVMTGFGGLLGIIAAHFGCFVASLKAAIKVMCQRQNVVLFPEGYTYLDGKMGECKHGATHICRETMTQLGEMVYLVPSYIRYGKYPGEWILKLPLKVQYAVLIAGFLYFRRGAKIVIGTPIAIASLPADDNEATAILKSRIQELDPQKSGF